MTQRVELWVPGRPLPKERVRFRSRRRGGPFTPEKTVELERRIAEAYMEAELGRFDGTFGLHVDYYESGQRIILYEVDWKATWTQADADNLIKLTADGLQDRTHKAIKPEHRREVAFKNDTKMLAVSAVKHPKGTEPT